MVKDSLPVSKTSCFLTNNRHPWDGRLSDAVVDIEDHRDGRLGSKEEEEEILSQAMRHPVNLTEAQVQDFYLQRIFLFRFSIIPDGNCLFRAVSQALFGTQNQHRHVREITLQHLTENIVDFLPFFEPHNPDDDILDFAYAEIERLKTDHFWGGFECLMAMSDIYNIEFHVVLGGHAKNSKVTIHKYYYGRNGSPEDMDDPPKKIFIIWMSCGHYDLAVDTPIEPIETQEWIAQREREIEFQRSLLTLHVNSHNRKKSAKRTSSAPVSGASSTASAEVEMDSSDSTPTGFITVSPVSPLEFGDVGAMGRFDPRDQAVTFTRPAPMEGEERVIPIELESDKEK